jgi:hypothetical protein
MDLFWSQLEYSNMSWTPPPYSEINKDIMVVQNTGLFRAELTIKLDQVQSYDLSNRRDLLGFKTTTFLGSFEFTLPFLAFCESS